MLENEPITQVSMIDVMVRELRDCIFDDSWHVSRYLTNSLFNGPPPFSSL